MAGTRKVRLVLGPVGKGSTHVDGHDISHLVRGVDVHYSVDSDPVVVLELLPDEVTIEADAQVVLRVNKLGLRVEAVREEA